MQGEGAGTAKREGPAWQLSCRARREGTGEGVARSAGGASRQTAGQQCMVDQQPMLLPPQWRRRPAFCCCWRNGGQLPPLMPAHCSWQPPEAPPPPSVPAHTNEWRRGGADVSGSSQPADKVQHGQRKAGPAAAGCNANCCKRQLPTCAAGLPNHARSAGSGHGISSGCIGRNQWQQKAINECQ